MEGWFTTILFPPPGRAAGVLRRLEHVLAQGSGTDQRWAIRGKSWEAGRLVSRNERPERGTRNALDEGRGVADPGHREFGRSCLDLLRNESHLSSGN